jgi:rhodanese-related sulfurtransferase
MQCIPSSASAQQPGLNVQKEKFMIRQHIKFGLLVLTFLPITLKAQQPAHDPSAHTAPAGKTKVLTRAEFDQVISANPDVILLDLRRPDEITNIGGFPVYLSIQIADLDKYWNHIPKGSKVITVSNHAARAVKAGDKLDEKGVTILGAVGAQTYEQEGGTIVHIKAPAPKTATAEVAH